MKMNKKGYFTRANSKWKFLIYLSKATIWMKIEIFQQKFTWEKRSQLFGVREGNEGIDCSINFLLLLLRPGEVSNSVWGGDTLLLLGDVDFMIPLVGEVLPWSVLGISSSSMDSNCLWNLGRGRKNLGLPSPWLAAYVPPDEDPTPRIDGKRVGLFFKETGGCIGGLRQISWLSIDYRHYKLQVVNIYYSVHCTSWTAMVLQAGMNLESVLFLYGKLISVNSHRYNSSRGYLFPLLLIQLLCLK